MDINNPITKKYMRAVVSYMAYFGSRFVGNDIQVLCGNIMDHSSVKTFTLFCIMFQATDSLQIAAIMTTLFLSLQYILSVLPACIPYVDKTTAKNIKIKNTVWAKNADLDDLGHYKRPFSYHRN